VVVADPSFELVHLVTEAGDPVDALARARLLRRRFGLALPPPFAGEAPVDGKPRVAEPADGPAIAAIKWRAFGANYRGILSDEFLDQREVVPPASFWVGRAMVPPSRRHRLLVWGRPGTVFGYADLGPAHPTDPETSPETEPEAGADVDARADADADAEHDVGEVYELYVDPSTQGRGIGSDLLTEADSWLTSCGFDRAELSVLAGNVAAQQFYAQHGWTPTGRVIGVDLGVVAFDEIRLERPLS